MCGSFGGQCWDLGVPMSPWNRHPHWETSLPWIQFLAPNSFNASHRRITPFSSSDFGDADLLLASVILGVSELCARDDINRKVECTIQIVNCVISITEYTKALPDCERKVQLGSGVLATHLLAHSALARWTLAIGTKESKMSTSKTKSISAFFEPAKRLRVDAKANAALISRIEPDAGVAHVLKKTARDTQTVRNVSTTAKGSDGFELYPLPGFEPPPFRGVNQQQSVLQETEETVAMGQELKEVVPAQEKGPEMTKERQMRMELNKTIARAKRNLRTCEEHIAECQKLGRSFPDFEKLLVEQSWLEVVQDEFTKQYMNILHIFVQRESAGKLPVYPPLPLIFNAFNTCPFDKVKVVIIGQDPYHGPGQAMGLSFSVPKGTKIPSSLVNIFKEIRDDVGATVPSHGNLEKWAHQGVLLLNAVLTVREHHANSHAKKGWEAFTDAVIRAVSQKREGVVFLLWGNSAHDKTRLIDTTQHHILKAAHPSGLSAHRGFFNCRHFSKTNKILEKAGELPIDWQL